MELLTAAACLEALGNAHRLEIYRLLVQAGSGGLPVGRIRDHLELPGSTLSHHLARLVKEGLISQQRESRSLICCCNYQRMEQVLDFLTVNCCRGVECASPSATACANGATTA